MKHSLTSTGTSFLACFFIAVSGVVWAQDSTLNVDNLMKELPKQCEEPSRILAEAKFSKWDKRANEISRALTETDKQAVYAVMKDQCVSVQLVMLLRTLKSTISESEWIKLGGETQLRQLLVRIERSM